MKKGDVLARLHAPELEAAVLRLQVDRDYWKRRNTSDQRLLEQKAIPPDQEEASRRASDGADAAYKETLSRLQKTIEKSTFDGTVLKWYVEPGQNVMPGQPLLLVGDSKSEIHVDVIEEDVRRGLQVGTPVSIKGTVTSFLTGHIAEIAPMASATSRTIIIKIHWNEKEALSLPNGASIAVDFLIRTQNLALSVPINAIADYETDPHLFLIRKNRAFKQNVKTGIEENGWIAVEFSWNGTDPVAVTNLNSLSDSSSVFAVPSKEAKQ
jgi:multidrug resistance efflux pump